MDDPLTVAPNVWGEILVIAGPDYGRIQTDGSDLMDASTLGQGFIYLGLGLVLVGGLVLLLGRVVDLGNLPGDLVFQGDTVRVYVPIATMIVLSVVLTLLVNLVLRLFR